MVGVADGCLDGKGAIGAYWQRALDRLPQLRFTLHQILCGTDSVVLVYDGPKGASAEWFRFNDDGLVSAAAAHYP